MTRDPSRFVFVQPHLGFGGAESQTVEVLNGLSRRGHPCTLILHEREGGLLDELDPAVEVIALGFRSHLGLLRGALRARAVLRAMPASVVVVRLWSSIAMIGRVAASAPQHRYHFVEDLDPRDHARYIRFGRVKQWIVGTVFRRHESGALANTEHVAHAMVGIYRLGGVPPVVPCGVDVDRVRRLASASVALPAELRDDAFRVVTVGSLIERKGLRQLRSLLAGCSMPIDWMIVGEGPLEAWLRAAEDDAELRVILPGATPNPFPYVAAADVMVHGAASESFGVAILESLALGVPVVARDANGPQEIARHLPHAPLALYDGTNADSFDGALKKVRERAGRDDVRGLGGFDLSAVLERWERIARRGEGEDGVG